MRIIAIVGTIGGMVLRAYLASVVAYSDFLIFQLMQGSLWRWIALITVPFWALVLGLASLPVALLGSTMARAAGSVTGSMRVPAMLLALVFAGLAGTWLFIWYMAAAIELIDWRSRWPWPLAASIGAYLIDMPGSAGADRRHLTLSRPRGLRRPRPRSAGSRRDGA